LIGSVLSVTAQFRLRVGLTESWLKIKCTKTDNFPIVAFVEKLGAKPRRIACTIVDKKPTTSTTVVVGDGVFKSRTEAETGMKSIKVCSSN